MTSFHEFESQLRWEASRLTPNTSVQDDLVQEGLTVLWQKSLSHDASLGTLWNYAVKAVIGSMKNYLADTSKDVRIPRYRQEQLRKVHAASSQYRSRTNEEPGVYTLATLTGMSIEELGVILETKPEYVSLDYEVSEGVTVADTLYNEHALDPLEELLHAEKYDALKRAVSRLPNNMGRIVTLYYGLDEEDPLSAKEIGDRFNVSRQAIEQILSRALPMLGWYKETLIDSD